MDDCHSSFSNELETKKYTIKELEDIIPGFSYATAQSTDPELPETEKSKELIKLEENKGPGNSQTTTLILKEEDTWKLKGLRSFGEHLFSIDIPFDQIEGLSEKMDRVVREQAFASDHFDRFCKLTHREREVLCLVTQGKKQ